MNIESFADLLQAARLQAHAQRLLFVFAKAELPEDASPEQRAGFAAGQGGALAPAMCVDKGLAELSSFEALAQEAAQFGLEWRILFAAALGGSGAAEPAAQQVDQALQDMVQGIQQGQWSRYLAFDRQGVPVQLQ